MKNNPTYDVAIIGGGLAGLASAILLGAAGHSVVVTEKERYPLHKVCGEYVSMESWGFLESLGIPLSTLNLPVIKKLQLTAPGGRAFITRLPLGGFGISRYLLESLLVCQARTLGVTVLEGTKVEDVRYDGLFETVLAPAAGADKSIVSRICVGAFGKRSNLDMKWQRRFVKEREVRLQNYVAVKYHVQCDWPEECVGLHNFQDGYCGISRIEDGRYCLCYMTTAANLKACNGSIAELERSTLSRNPHLKEIFDNSIKLPGFPVTISQVSFSRKTQSENEVLLLGDAAGMITPLCGNGMSIALRTAKIASGMISEHLAGNLSLRDLLDEYERSWNKHFAGRLRTGRYLQRFFGSEALSNGFVGAFRMFPFLAQPVIRMTHGAPF